MNAYGDTPRPYILRVGVENGSFLPIGFVYKHDKIGTRLNMDAFLRKHIESTFPPVCPRWFKFRLSSVIGTSHTDWQAELDEAFILLFDVTGSNNPAKKLSNRQVHDTIILAKRASCVHFNGHTAVLMPSSVLSALKTAVASFSR